MTTRGTRYRFHGFRGAWLLTLESPPDKSSQESRRMTTQTLKVGGLVCGFGFSPDAVPEPRVCSFRVWVLKTKSPHTAPQIL